MPNYALKCSSFMAYKLLIIQMGAENKSVVKSRVLGNSKEASVVRRSVERPASASQVSEGGNNNLRVSPNNNLKASRSHNKEPTISNIQGSKTDKRLAINQSKVHYLEKPKDPIDAAELKTSEFSGKKIKKFNLNAVIDPKDNVKESHYFDESLGPINVAPTEKKEMADYRVGESEEFQTFQVKRFLYDVNLEHKIQA